MNAWAQTLLLWSWQSLLLVGFVLAVVRIARAQAAASRHSFWLLAVLVISVLPGVNAIVRALPVEAPAVAPIRYIAQLPEVTVEAFPAAAQSPASARDIVTPSLFAIWIAGVLIAAVRSIREHRRWRRIAGSVVNVEKTGLAVPIGYSAEVETPVLVGTLRPMIVLPANIVQQDGVPLFGISPRFDSQSCGTQHFSQAERMLPCDSSFSKESWHATNPAFTSPAKVLERRVNMILSHSSPVAASWQVPAIGRAAIVLGLASLVLPQSATLAEIPAPPRLEIPAASFQPLMESVSVIATAAATRASAEAAEPTAEPAPHVQGPESSFASISGIVFDQTGALVPGVKVTLIPSSGQEARTTTTNPEGAYAFDRIVPGEWTLQARVPDFTSADRKLLLRAGETGTHGVALAVARMEMVVTVKASRSAVAPNPASRPLPKRIGGDIRPATLLTQSKPVYPASAFALGVQDYVQLQAVIGKDGTITSLQVDPNRVGMGNTDLNKAAMDAVQQWRYSPATLNGVPIEIATTITVNFTLD
jgi:TonB family protein